MCYNQTGNITTLDGASLRLVDKFTYLGSSVSSTENDIDTRLTKAWTAIDRLSIIWKSDLTDEMKRCFFQEAVVSILLYGCTTWRLTKRLEKKLDGNYTRMLRAVLNKSWRQHPTRRRLYGHLPPITKTIQVRRARHAGYCWRSKDELVSDVLLWTPTYGQAKAGRPARTYIQQLCEDTGCNPEDLLEAMNDREKWRERVRDIRAGSTTWWWWLDKENDNYCGIFITKVYRSAALCINPTPSTTGLMWHENDSFWAEYSWFEIRVFHFLNCRSPRGIMAKMLDSGLEVSRSELQSRYCVYFRANTLGKGMNLLIPSAMVWIVSRLIFKKCGFGIK